MRCFLRFSPVGWPSLPVLCPLLPSLLPINPSLPENPPEHTEDRLCFPPAPLSPPHREDTVGCRAEELFWIFLEW